MSHAGIQLGEGTRAHLVEVVVDFGGGLVDSSDDDEVLLAGELGDESHDVGRCRCIEAAAWVTTKIQQGLAGLQDWRALVVQRRRVRIQRMGKIGVVAPTWWARPG